SVEQVLYCRNPIRSEGIKVEDPEVVEAVAEDKKALKRKNVQSRSKANYQASKRQKVSLEGSKKRKEDASVRSSLPATKKNRRSLEVGRSCSGTELNFVQSEVPDEEKDNILESSDDSEPLINKIKKNSAKRAQNRAKQTFNVNNDTLLCTKNIKHAPSSPDSKKVSEHSNGTAQPAANSSEIGRDTVCAKHNFPGLKDFAKKSLRTSKKKSKVSVPNDKDPLEGATAIGVAFLPVKATKIANPLTSDPPSHSCDHKPEHNVCSEVRSVAIPNIDKASLSALTSDPASYVCDHKSKQNLSSEVRNAATLKWSNHKARQNLSGSGNRTIAKKGATNALSSQLGHTRLNVGADEQHSLEQNAARTLSSRFSSLCGAIAGISSDAAQKITEPIMAVPAFNSASGAPAAEKDESSPVQSSGRALRPRKHRQNHNGTKRYGEICFSDVDAFQILNRRIKVFWPLDNKWYYGTVKSYDPTNKLHYVRYDDRDEEWLQLRDEKFKLQLLPGEADGRVRLLDKSVSEKVEGLDGDGIQSGPKAMPYSELNNERQLGANANDAFRHGVENSSCEKSSFTLLDASKMSRRDDIDGNGCNNGSNLRGDIDGCVCNNGSSLGTMRDIKAGKSAINNSDKKTSRKVYVRRRYRNTGSKGTEEGRNEKGEEKVSSDDDKHTVRPELFPTSSTGQKLSSALGVESLRFQIESGTAATSEAGKNNLSGSLEDKLNHLHSVGGGDSLRLQQYKDSMGTAIISASVACNDLSNEKSLELMHIVNDCVMLSDFSAASGKNSPDYHGFEILPRVINSSGDYVPLVGLELTNWHFVFPKELDCGNPLLCFWTTLPLTYPRCGLPSVCCRNNLILRQSRVLNSVWPDAWLEILVADGFFGSSLFSFGGSLQNVVNGFCKIMAAFVKPLESQYSCMSLEAMKVMNFKAPIQSLSFRFSLSQGLGNTLDFVFYDFKGITRARWRDLFKKLEALCSLQLNSSLENPCNANSWFLQSCNSQVSGLPVFSSLATFKEGTGITSASDISFPLLKPRDSFVNALQGRNTDWVDNEVRCGPQFQKFLYHHFYQSASVCRGNGYVAHFESGHVAPPFSLTFAAAPTFFLGLHSKLLLGKPIAAASFESHSLDALGLESWESIDLSEEAGSDAPTVRDSSKRTSQTIKGTRCIHLETPAGYVDETVFSGDHASDSSARLWQVSKLSKVDVDASPISTADGSVFSSPRSTYSELNMAGTAAGLTETQDNRESFVPGNVFKLRRCPTNRSSWRLTGNARPRLVQRMNSAVSEIESGSRLKVDEREPTAGQSFHSYFDTLHGQPESKPDKSSGYTDTLTNPGRYWSREKYGLASSSQLWQDNRIQHAYNSSAEPRKRRSVFSNLIFSENADGVPFKYRGHMRRGRPSRQNREEKLKKVADNSSDLKYLDSVSCNANILVVGVDRGWRESGAQVVLEASEHNEWMLSVKLHGFTKYTHKAQQVVQSGSTNRYTHAMLWKGGKDWSLEFLDRKQWFIFKEMHEECYNRNLRAASVRHIPIPGVHEIEDYDCASESFHFVRPSSRYIRQMESEVEMALATSRVMYDMDSEDEEWLGHLNNSRIGDGSCQPGHVSEETFERIMDLLEKAAFTQQRELLNSDEVADFCWDIATVEVVKAIHAHWQEKRWRKGMALVRHFQPASWERYQQQIKEWESQMNELQHSPTGNKQQLNLERPPMFAFCLKPRGLEVPDKTQKQRSHRKFNVGQQITLRDQENVAFPATRRYTGISI
ncbi:hypothetical protein KI387_007531, partial [Taxus chinensis]